MVWLRDLQHLQSNHLSPAFSGYAAPRLDAATRRALARRCLPRFGCGTSQSLADCWFSRLSHIAPVGDAAFWCVQLKAGCSARHGGEADMNNLIDVHASASATRSQGRRYEHDNQNTPKRQRHIATRAGYHWRALAFQCLQGVSASARTTCVCGYSVPYQAGAGVSNLWRTLHLRSSLL